MSKERKMVRKNHDILRRIVLVILGFVLGINIYSMNARIVGHNTMPTPFGIGFGMVMSGSMEPTLNVNDLVIVKKIDNINVGDIVVYQSGDDLILHRVITLYGDTVVTKGDANNTADEPFSRDQIKGVVLFHIPYLGWLITATKSPAGFILIGLIAYFVIEFSLRKFFAITKEENGEDEIKAEIKQLRKELGKDKTEEKPKEEKEDL